MLIGIEANADFYHLPTIGEIRLGIAAGINLLKGMTSVAHLQLHDVDGVGHEDHHIHATACHLHLRADIDMSVL